MKFKNANGEEVKVLFTRDHVCSTVDKSTIVKTTKAYVIVNDNVHSMGVAKCHPNDNFSKETGRKLALRNAISKFNKPERTEYWNTYRTWGKIRF